MRKTLIYIVTMMVLFLSCKAQEINQEAIHGTFHGQYKGSPTSYFYTLELNQNGSFKFAIKFHMASPQCNGKWRIVDNEFILLECDEGTNPFEMISSAYMSEKDHKLQILSKNKLKYKDVVLKREK